MPGRQANAEIFGREPELRTVRAFVHQGSSARGLLLCGRPGAGKTTLWEAGVSAAREPGVRVLCTHASEAEAQLAFTALIDLLDGVGTEGLDVPAPQLQALEVALLRAPPAGAPPDAKAIAFGFLNTLRALEAGGPLMLAVDDEEVRARHLALAAEGTDEELAATLAAAAASAGARGAVRDRVELAEHALRLTASDDPERSERLLSLADSLSVSGTREDEQRLTGLLQPQLDSLPSGTARVRAYLLLTDGLIQSNDDIQRYLDQALAESSDDAALRARVLAEISENMALIRVERIREAESLAQEAASVVGLQGRPLHSLSWALALQGRDVAHLCEEDPAPGSGR